MAGCEHCKGTYCEALQKINLVRNDRTLEATNKVRGIGIAVQTGYLRDCSEQEAVLSSVKNLLKSSPSKL